jgi:hypothetical protein
VDGWGRGWVSFGRGEVEDSLELLSSLWLPSAPARPNYAIVMAPLVSRIRAEHDVRFANSLLDISVHRRMIVPYSICRMRDIIPDAHLFAGADVACILVASGLGLLHVKTAADLVEDADAVAETHVMEADSSWPTGREGVAVSDVFLGCFSTALHLYLYIKTGRSV